MSERKGDGDPTDGRRHGGWQDIASDIPTSGPWPVRIQGSASHGSSAGEYQTAEVSGDGVVIDGGADVDWGPFVWLDVGLPASEPVHVLGAVEGRHDPASLALNVKFKHLFPDHRRRWHDAVHAEAPTETCE